ncbi:MAG: VOC family protein [Actinomycetota bacterium]
MGEVTSYPNGAFCWVDLGTTDAEGAKRFYSEILGWDTEDVDTPDGIYTIGRMQGKDVAGLHAHGEEDAHNWDSYIAVEDLDATLDRVKELGCRLDSGPHTIPGSARMAVIIDGGGARVCLWEAAGYPGASLVNETGCWTWNDLSTRDPAAAEAFYRGLFGWDFQQVIPGYWSISMGNLLIGGMRSMGDGDRPASWMPYFVVADADKAVAMMEERGGQVFVPPTAVPAGRFSVAADPRGAGFGLIEMGPEGPSRGVDGSAGPEFRPRG